MLCQQDRANHHSTQAVEMSVTLNNSPIQDYLRLDNHTLPTYENLYILYHNILYIYTLDTPVPLT